jgi:hypothetical protein
MLHMNHINAPTLTPNLISVPLMTRQRYSEISGIPLGVLLAQCERGMWPQVTIGKRCSKKSIGIHALTLLSHQKAFRTACPQRLREDSRGANAQHHCSQQHPPSNTGMNK